MTAIEQLREWFTRDKRPEKSAWITGDTVETRAILGLADRLEKLEGMHPAANESPPEPFKITGPGRYKMRNGGYVEIALVDPNSSLPWHCKGSEGSHGWWSRDGLYEEEISGADIVAGPFADEPQQEPDIAGLSGFITLTPDGRAYVGKAISLNAATVKEQHIVLDLSKVPASAIMKPAEPKRETRKVWVNFYRNRDDHSIWPSRSAAGDVATSERIACVETEITFTHGQGLGGGQ